jgi:membrane protein DedA with SNARE-associated domain
MLQRIVDLLQDHSLGIGYAFVFAVLLACGFGFPMPEDVILISGGVLAWLASPLEEMSFTGMIHDEGLVTMVLVGLGGILAGDSVIYWAGRKLGRRVAEFRVLRHMVTPEKLEKVEKRLRHRGNVVVMIARFLPGLRAPTYFTVGHSHFAYWKFLLYDGLAALVSAPVWVCLGFWFGDDLGRAAREAGRFGQWVLGAVLIVVGLIALRWWWRRRKARPGATPSMPEEG